MKKILLNPIISKEEKAVNTVVDLWNELKRFEAMFGSDSRSAINARSTWRGALSVIDAMGLREKYIATLVRT